MFKKGIREPVEGTAKVVMCMPRANVQSNFAAAPIPFRVTVELSAPGIEPHQAEVNRMFQMLKQPVRGAEFPAVLDRKDPSRFEIKWNEGEGDGSLGALIEEVKEARASGQPSDRFTFLTPAAGASAPAPSDPLDRLQKLADLRDRGVLSDAEFAAQKAKILGSD